MKGEIKFTKIVNKLYLSFMVVATAIAGIAGYLIGINPELEKQENYKIAQENIFKLNQALRENKYTEFNKEHNLKFSSSLSDQQLEESSAEEIENLIKQNVCFLSSGYFQPERSNSYCEKTISSFKKGSIFLGFIKFAGILFTVPSILFLFRKWIIWLFY